MKRTRFLVTMTALPLVLAAASGLEWDAAKGRLGLSQALAHGMAEPDNPCAAKANPCAPGAKPMQRMMPNPAAAGQGQGTGNPCAPGMMNPCAPAMAGDGKKKRRWPPAGQGQGMQGQGMMAPAGNPCAPRQMNPCAPAMGGQARPNPCAAARPKGMMNPCAAGEPHEEGEGAMMKRMKKMMHGPCQPASGNPCAPQG